MGSRGDGADHHNKATAAMAQVAPVAASSSKAFFLTVQGQWVAGGGRAYQGLVTSGLTTMSRERTNLFFGGSGPSSSRGVFPFSATENLRISTLDVAARRKKKK